MHLADRGGREGLAGELGEARFRGTAERTGHGGVDVGPWNQGCRVLQLAQLRLVGGRHEIGPRREHLAELHERRAERFERVTQPPRAGRPRSTGDAHPEPLAREADEAAEHDQHDLQHPAD